MIYVGTTPHPVTVTTRIITFLIGNPYKPSFVTVTGWGVDRRYMLYAVFSKHTALYNMYSESPQARVLDSQSLKHLVNRDVGL